MPLRTGETFAGYRILRLLGSGGNGRGIPGPASRLPRHEALKVLRSDLSSDDSFRERFIREADLAAGLRHPHIVSIHDRGEHDGQLWIAMDYVDGTDLAHQMVQHYPAGMPSFLVAPIVSAVASALDYAHKKSLLHRDVKPANIIVTDLDTDDPSVFLADFGIARPLDDTSGITTTNMTVGTVAYAAPEQLMGEAIDGRSDEYALAATTYHLLTGSQLFPHTNPAVVISRHLNTTPPRVGDSRSDLAGLDAALQKALAKDPDDRYPSCIAFAHSLRGESHGQTAVSPGALTLEAPRQNRQTLKAYSGSPGKDSPRRVTESRLWVVGLTAAVMVLLIGIGAFAARTLQSSDRVATETTSAVTQSATASSPMLSTPAVTSSPAATEPTPTSVKTSTPRDAEGSIAPTAPSSTAVPNDTPDEQGFLAAVAGLPQYVKYGRICGEACLLDQGYKACAAFDQYPDDAQRATRVITPVATRLTVRSPWTVTCSCFTRPITYALDTHTCTTTTESPAD